MMELPRTPHGDGFLGVMPRAFSKRMREALEHDQRGCAGRMCRCEQRPCATRRSLATRTASRLPRSSNTAVMLSAHGSKVGSAPGETGSDAPMPGWSKKMSRPSDVIASIHP